VIEMAETVKGTVVLRSVPNRKVEARIAEYLSEIYDGVPLATIAGLVSRTKPLTLVKDVTRVNGKEIADQLNELGASAYFLQYIGSRTRH
jgi:hypothetical protein